MKPVMQPWQVKEARRSVLDGDTVQQVANRLRLNRGPVYTAVIGITWSSIHNPPPVPVGLLFERRKRPVRECQNCASSYRVGGTSQRCGPCSTYWYRHGEERPLNHHLRQGRHARLSKKRLAELYKKYQSGLSLEAIAEVEDLPFSPETLRRRFVSAGYELRPKAGVHQKLTAPLVRQLRYRHYNDGVPVHLLARELPDVSYLTVYDAVKWKTWRKAGGPMPKEEGEKRPCAECGLLTTHESGKCCYCR